MGVEVALAINASSRTLVDEKRVCIRAGVGQGGRVAVDADAGVTEAFVVLAAELAERLVVGIVALTFRAGTRRFVDAEVGRIHAGGGVRACARNP